MRRVARLTVALLTIVALSAGAAAQQRGIEPPPEKPQAEPGGFDTSSLVSTASQLNATDLPRLVARADMGDGQAQVLLGLAHEMGSAGLTPQPPEALSWFLKAAAQGITWAEVWAADFYFSGSPGIARDFMKALALYRSAADRGDPKAAFFVGQIYFFGDGVDADHREAARWYRRAIDADPAAVQPMITLAESPCDSLRCVSLRQVMAAIMTDTANRFIDGWDDAKHEWDVNVRMSDAERCGLTSSDRTSTGAVQNYFCDSAPIGDEASGVALAKQLADEVEKALPAGYSRRFRDDLRPGPSTFFAKDGFPHLRVTFNTTPGSAQNRVTLLVGP